MAVKYSIPFFDDFNQEWRVDIDLPDYVGDPVELTGVGRVFCQPEWSAGDDPYEPIVNSKVTVQFYNRGGEVNVQELQLLPDMTGRLILYRGTELWWTGYVIPDGIQRMLQPMPYPITITATDGLAMLKDVPFALGNNWPMPAGVSNRSPMSFIRYVLYGFPSSPHLGITLPIRFQCDIENVEYGDSAIMGTISWGALGEAWTDFNGNSRTCMYILEGMLRALQCRIMQFGGKWHIQRINDVVGGTYTWTELGTETGTAPTVTTGVTDMVAGINPTFYPMVNENQVATMKAAYTDVVATYEHYQAENVLPNGGFDTWVTAGPPFYWGFTPNPDTAPMFEQNESLRPDGFGNAVRLTNDGSATEDAEWILSGGLPVDANILFKRFLWGFTIMPTQYGFPYDGQETIDWSSNPLKVSVKYTVPIEGGVRDYYLNEFGYWQWQGRGLDLGVLFINVETTYLGSNVNRQEIIFEGSPNVGDVLQVGIRNNPGGGYQWYSFTVTLIEEGNLEIALIELMNAITNTRIASEQVVMDNPNRGRIRFQDLINYGTPSGNTYKSGATQEFEYVFPSVDQLKINDVATVAFQGKGGNSEILLPDPGILDGNQDPLLGIISFRFYVKPGQQYVLDDVYMRVEENNDVYQSRIQDANRRSNRKTVDLNISSSFSGFMLSNLMTSYDKSNTEFRFTDGKYTGSLTGMTANAMMRYHHLPREIFEGDIYTNGRDWQVNHIYLFDGKKYLPLVSRYNIETGVVTLTAIEGSDDANEFVEEHYGSNELILSNT
jgi:hypothetical protein